MIFLFPILAATFLYFGSSVFLSAAFRYLSLACAIIFQFLSTYVFVHRLLFAASLKIGKMWWILNRLYRDTAFIKSRGHIRRETGTGTRRGSRESLEAPVSSENGEFSLRVLTLNVWGLYFLKHIEMRIDAICERLRDYDVVALQEVGRFSAEFSVPQFPSQVWHSRERDILREAGRKFGLIYAHYFACGVGLPFWPGNLVTFFQEEQFLHIILLD